MSKKAPPPSKTVIFGFLGVAILFAIVGVTLAVQNQGNIAFLFFLASIVSLIVMIKKLQNADQKKKK